MKDLSVIVYTMRGCPFCDEFKKMLKENNIDFFDRDIDDNQDEYEIFSQITENDMIPALLIIEEVENQYESYLYAPERDYNELTEAIEIIKEHRNSLRVI